MKKQKRFQCHAILSEKPIALTAPHIVAIYPGNSDYFMINDNILVHPGGSATARRYPIERFATVIQLLRHQGYAVLVTGWSAKMRYWQIYASLRPM